MSDLLKSVKYKDKNVTLIRGGEPIAAILTVEKPPREKKLAELPEILKSLPSLEDDAEAFAHDIEVVLMLRPALPKCSVRK